MSGNIYLPHYNSSHAIVVGIDAYQHLSPLNYAVSDATAVADAIVRNCGFPTANVRLLTNAHATYDEIRRAYLGLAGPATDRDDRVLFFFAGHGMTVTGRRGEVGYLVPVNGDPSQLSTLIPWSELTRQADVIDAKHLLFIMDACYGGLALARSSFRGSARFLDDMLRRGARQVLTAGKANEPVADGGGPRAGHSIFTGHLLDAIDNLPAANAGVVTANAVMAYVYDRVSRDAHSHQTPAYGHIDGDGDFILLAPKLGRANEPSQIESSQLIFVPAELRTPEERSRSDLISEVKELVSEPRHRIKLDDVAMDLLRATLARLDPTRSNPNEPVDADSIAKRLERYDSAIEDLAIVCILVARWGTEEQSELLARVFSRTADQIQATSGYVIWSGLQWYPLSVLQYYAGIAALSGRNWASLRHVFLTASSDPRHSGEERFLITLANSGLSEANEAFKMLPGHERQFVPRSELLFQRLQPLLDDLMFLGSGYEVLFDRFEVLNALSHAFARPPRYHAWGPPGRFAWKWRGGNTHPIAAVEKEASTKGALWEPLVIGMFDGQREKFEEVLAKYKEFLRTLQWY